MKIQAQLKAQAWGIYSNITSVSAACLFSPRNFLFLEQCTTTSDTVWSEIDKGADHNT